MIYYLESHLTIRKITFNIKVILTKSCIICSNELFLFINRSIKPLLKLIEKDFFTKRFQALKILLSINFIRRIVVDSGIFTWGKLLENYFFTLMSHV